MLDDNDVPYPFCNSLLCLACGAPVRREEAFMDRPLKLGDPLYRGWFLSLHAPYGSVFDTTSVTGVICDDCVPGLIASFRERPSLITGISGPRVDPRLECDALRPEKPS